MKGIILRLLLVIIAASVMYGYLINLQDILSQNNLWVAIFGLAIVCCGFTGALIYFIRKL